MKVVRGLGVVCVSLDRNIKERRICAAILEENYDKTELRSRNILKILEDELKA